MPWRYPLSKLRGEPIQLSQDSVCPAVVRLKQRGLDRSGLGISETNRKVKFYSLTKAGRKRLHVKVAHWEKTTAQVGRFLEASS
jgi:PadR family transcriptional regulator, regulatory protein PadR